MNPSRSYDVMAAYHQSKVLGSNVLRTCGFWLLVLLPLFYSLGNHPVYNSSEARYATIARAMATGDSPLLIPHWDGQPHLTKPPGFYWLVAGSIRLFGDNPLAIRLPGALSGVGLLLIIYALTRRLHGRGRARCAVLFASVCPLFLGVSRAGLTDGPLGLCMFASLAAGIIAVDERHSARWWLIAASGAGLAGLIKGPIGWLPLTLWIVYAGWFGSGRTPRLRTVLPAVLPVMVLPLVAWTLYVLNDVQGAGRTWWAELVGRAGEAADHPGPWWYYLPVVVLGLFPATTWLTSPPRSRRQFDATRPTPVAAKFGKVTGVEGLVERFWWVYGLVLVLGFSLMRGKLPTYMMPLVPPAAMLAAAGVDRWLSVPIGSTPREGGLLARPEPAWATLAAAAGFGLGVFLIVTRGWPVPLFWLWPVPLLVLAGAVLTMLPLHRRGARRRALAAGYGAMLILTLWLCHVEDVAMGSHPARRLVDVARQAIGVDAVDLRTVGWLDESLTYYTGSRPRQADPRFTATEWRTVDRSRLVLAATPGAWQDFAASRPGLLELRYERFATVLVGYPPRRVDLYRVRAVFHVEHVTPWPQPVVQPSISINASKCSRLWKSIDRQPVPFLRYGRMTTLVPS